MLDGYYVRWICVYNTAATIKNNTIKGDFTIILPLKQGCFSQQIVQQTLPQHHSQ